MVRSLGRGFAAQPEFSPTVDPVNVLSFGALSTPMTGSEDPSMVGALRQWAGAHVPVRRWGTPAEAAAPAAFLAGDASRYMTGSEVAVDGGLGQL